MKIVQILKMRKGQHPEWIRILGLLSLEGVFHSMRVLAKDFRLTCGHEIFQRREKTHP
jgi:hypothetical protein